MFLSLFWGPPPACIRPTTAPGCLPELIPALYFSIPMAEGGPLAHGELGVTTNSTGNESWVLQCCSLRGAPDGEGAWIRWRRAQHLLRDGTWDKGGGFKLKEGRFGLDIRNKSLLSS